MKQWMALTRESCTSGQHGRHQSLQSSRALIHVPRRTVFGLSPQARRPKSVKCPFFIVIISMNHEAHCKRPTTVFRSTEHLRFQISWDLSLRSSLLVSAEGVHTRALERTEPIWPRSVNRMQESSFVSSPQRPGPEPRSLKPERRAITDSPVWQLLIPLWTPSCKRTREKAIRKAKGPSTMVTVACNSWDTSRSSSGAFRRSRTLG